MRIIQHELDHGNAEQIDRVDHRTSELDRVARGFIEDCNALRLREDQKRVANGVAVALWLALDRLAQLRQAFEFEMEAA